MASDSQTCSRAAVENFVASFDDGSSVVLPGRELGGVCRLPASTSVAAVLAAMVLDHCVGRHVCVVAPRGWGKTFVAKAFSAAVGMDHVVTTVQV